LNVDFQDVQARHPAALPGSPAALRGVSFSVQRSEHVAVIGPSGAGKTTLLHVMAAALKPMQGQLRLNGQNPWSLSGPALRRLRGQLFLAPQVPPLPPRQRVVSSVLAGQLPSMSTWASLKSLFYPHDIALAHQALSHFNVEDKLFSRVDRLSGGERQRVGLARAVPSPASLWLIDEPLSALDPTRSRQAVDSLLSVARDRGITLVSTLHQVDVALERFARIIGLRQGVKVFDAPAGAVTQAMLADLYGDEFGTLGEPMAPPVDLEPSPAEPTVVLCR
jgi:phosphonate transport system ATP-binding protein